MAHLMEHRVQALPYLYIVQNYIHAWSFLKQSRLSQRTAVHEVKRTHEG